MARTPQVLANAAAPAFRLGNKQVFLPNHSITLIRRDKVPANWATFNVPLRFTKFDLRDYLWNLYGVEALSVRSWVKQAPVMRKGTKGTYYRPQSEKFMMIEMERPFVFPAPPTGEELDSWNKKLFDARESLSSEHYRKEYKRQMGKLVYPSKEAPDMQRQKLSEQAEALLKGEKEWEPPTTLDSKWDRIVKATKQKKT